MRLLERVAKYFNRARFRRRWALPITPEKSLACSRDTKLDPQTVSEIREVELDLAVDGPPPTTFYEALGYSQNHDKRQAWLIA